MSKVIFHFPEIKGSLCKVNLSKDNGNSWNSFKVQVKDEDLDARIAKHLPSLSADLIDLGTAIFVSDWLSKRKLHEEPSQIKIKIPVRNTNLFSQSSILNQLKYLLNWFTDDHWSFEFIDRQSKRTIESQSVLSATNERDIEIALWSGGLDSLAGLYFRYKQNPKTNFYLVGTGFNKKIVGKQKDVFNSLVEHSEIQASLRQVPYYLQDTSHKSNHSFMRSRGLTFMLIGAAVCLAMNKSKLHIYENGVGALNLPYRKSEVGLDHTRSVHPVSLIKTSNFLSNLIGNEFTIENPFIFHTKAQMCQPIISDELDYIVFDTTTCDSSHRSTPSQCGYCSSCLLRRQSILANSNVDKSGYVLTNGTPSNKVNLKIHLDAVLNQTQTWKSIFIKSDNHDDRWKMVINEYPQIEMTTTFMSNEYGLAKNQVEMKITDMFKLYCNEWDKTADQIISSYSK